MTGLLFIVFCLATGCIVFGGIILRDSLRTFFDKKEFWIAIIFLVFGIAMANIFVHKLHVIVGAQKR